MLRRKRDVIKQDSEEQSMRVFAIVRLVLFPILLCAQNASPWKVPIEPLPGTAADLIGEWSKSHVSTVDFVDPSTGAHANPSGERLNVRFFADGAYKLGWLLQSSLYNCTSTVFGEKTGAYQIQGNAISMKD